MLKRFTRLKTSRAPLEDAVRVEHPIQRVPAEVGVGQALVRLKVDVALGLKDRILIAGWMTGEVAIAVETDQGIAQAELHRFKRTDVADHFGLDASKALGFAIELPATSQARVLWEDTASGARFASALSIVGPEAIGESDQMLLGPFAALLQAGESDRSNGVDAANIRLIRESDLLDIAWYIAAYPDVAEAGADPVAHYYFQGAAEGRNPNYLFDTRSYLERYPDVPAATNPLLHYLQFGEKEGRQPSLYFDPSFYRYQLNAAEPLPGKSLLAHYLAGGWGHYSPNEFFSTDYYLESNPDVRDSGVDPLQHYVGEGWRESRRINRVYCFEKYRDILEARLGRPVEPLRYYLMLGRGNGESLPRHGAVHVSEGGGFQLANQLQASQQPGPHFERELIGNERLAEQARARMFAFYLPQFHPFPENDQWWGKGFTEWTNVTRALPRFSGHQQPRLPRDLGYYDLRNEETIRAQVEMAKASGVAGFCFYYYWFNRKRLLDRPLDLFLESDIDFPFCLMWANENWTRRWDGLESDVLVSQEYLESDDEALVADFARYFADPRYERVDGRPLLFIYRPGIIPDARQRIAHWRTLFRSKHGVEPIIMMAQCFGDEDPRPFGLDGAIEFPPHKLAADLPPVNSELEVLDPGFKGHYLKYDDLVKRSREVAPQGFDLIRTLVPSWDNEARKPGRGMGFVAANPDKYEDWLRYLVRWSGEHPVAGGHRYVFVNAWNEWAEGAHLEPDVHNGCAYLNATLRGLVGVPRARNVGKDLLLVGHDAYLHGAQLLTLNIMRTLKESFGVNVTLLLLEGGPLVEEYRKLGEVHVATDGGLPLDLMLDRVTKGVSGRVALCNTVVAGEVVRLLAERGFNVVSLVHELPRLIKERGLERNARAIASHASRVVFASDYVRAGFEGIAGPLGDKAALRPQGIYQSIARAPQWRGALREKLGLPDDARIVINVGYGDLRKGFDLFLELARRVCSERTDTHFVWLGHLHPDLETWLGVDALESPLRDHLHLVPFDKDVAPYLNAADVMALTSREDPYPSTVMEALASGIPVVAFDGGGGYVEAVRRHAVNGSVVPMADVAAMAAQVQSWLEGDDEEQQQTRSRKAIDEYSWRDYVFGLLQLIDPGLKKVSVVVPNYNYARYLPERLASILEQSLPIYELIVLDDKSPDNSVEVIRDVLEVCGREAQVVVNRKNSGSVFRQWEKGASLARGDYLWIAEADDLASCTFLDDVLKEFDDATALGFSDSAQIDQDGKRIGDSYSFYYEDLPSNPLSAGGRIGGSAFVDQALAIKNVILNVSAVVFRRQSLLAAFERDQGEVMEYRVAGDWRLYGELLRQDGVNVAYSPSPGNVHRRHSVSVTHALNHDRHLAEIERVQNYLKLSFDLSPTCQAEAARYLDSVSRQMKGVPADAQ